VSSKDPDKPTSRVGRAIDPPNVPSWRRPTPPARSAPDADEDAPTENIEGWAAQPPEPAVVVTEGRPAVRSAPPAPPAPDPATLTERSQGSQRSPLSERIEPAPPAPRPPEPSKEPRMASEDPRELARRLAEEAKRKLNARAEPAPRPPDPIDPVDDDDGGPIDEVEPDVVIASRPLAERASTSTTSRQLSAMEALKAARDAEQRRTTEGARARTPAAEAPRQARAPGPPSPKPPAAAERSGAPQLGQAGAVVAELLPGAVVESVNPVANPDVFRALWKAHRARAVHEGQLPLAATASVLLDALDRVPTGWLVALRVSIGGARWAAWVDLDRRVVLGLAQPADVYLVG
jgi:hypothetical protein